VPDQVDWRKRVDREQVTYLIEPHIERLPRGRIGQAGVVDQDVDPAERRFGSFDELGSAAVSRQIGRRGRGAVRRAAGPPRFLKRRSVRRGEKDTMACLQERQCDLAAKSAPRSGHQCHTIDHRRLRRVRLLRPGGNHVRHHCVPMLCFAATGVRGAEGTPAPQRARDGAAGAVTAD
jgi:hypothetical protein